MTLEEIKKILMNNKFKIDGSLDHIWTFNETTILVNGRPVQQYSIYEENGEFYLNSNQPIYRQAEDHLLFVKSDQNELVVSLVPKISRDKGFVLEKKD